MRICIEITETQVKWLMEYYKGSGIDFQTGTRNPVTAMAIRYFSHKLHASHAEGEKQEGIG